MAKRQPELLKDLILRRRKELNLSQRDVARAMGMNSLDYIGMVESGIRRLDLERLKKISEVLELPLEKLVELHFRELYEKPETRWLIDLLFGEHLDLARRINKLPAENQRGLKYMLEALEKDAAKNTKSENPRVLRMAV